MLQAFSDLEVCPGLDGKAHPLSTRAMKGDGEVDMVSGTGGGSTQDLSVKFRTSIGVYFRKLRGGDSKRLPVPPFHQVCAAFPRRRPLV